MRVRAAKKLAGIRVPIELLHGYARDAERLLRDRSVNKIISSLVFHQVPLEEKRAGLASMYAALVPSGMLYVADYGLQRTPKMRKRFQIVQKGDGYENTAPNAQGVLPGGGVASTACVICVGASRGVSVQRTNQWSNCARGACSTHCGCGGQPSLPASDPRLRWHRGAGGRRAAHVGRTVTLRLRRKVSST